MPCRTRWRGRRTLPSDGALRQRVRELTLDDGADSGWGRRGRAWNPNECDGLFEGPGLAREVDSCGLARVKGDAGLVGEV
jgi:hypothetical protein